MDYKFLGKDMDREQLRALSDKDREVLAAELRDKILNTVSKNGGHLASNLGTVELTIALLSVFDSQKDKIVFDVGHQSYSYKLLTGRFGQFDTLRQKGGISGFPRINESESDAFDTGHSSTSISAAVGMARARDLKGDDNYVVAIIGDGALNGGLAYEAINDIGHNHSKMLIILNDNEMSIDKNVGGMSEHLSNLRVSSGYLSAKKTTESFLRKLGIIGRGLIKIIIAIKDFFRFLLYRKKPTMFEDLGLLYYGPIDGHDTAKLIKTIEAVKDLRVPVLLHVATQKGKGYKPSEDTPSDYHGVGPFNLEEGIQKKNSQSFTTAFSGVVTDLAVHNKNIVVICAAMAQGTGLEDFSMKYPSRFFDCGIAEEHCVTMAAGMARCGFIPIVAIYSTFLQRAYDEIIHDVCFMDNHVIFAIDRAGFVGNDGHTHHGLYDMAYMSSMPNTTIFAPHNYSSLKDCFAKAAQLNGPVAVRYPKGSEEDNIKTEDVTKPQVISRKGTDFALISIGTTLKAAEDAMQLLENQNLRGTHINLTMVKPYPTEQLSDMCSGIQHIFTIEEGIREGGIGQSITSDLPDYFICHNIGVENPIIKASSRSDQLKTAGLDADSISNKIIKFVL